MSAFKWSRLTLLLTALLTLAAVFCLLRLQFDYDFNKFYPKGDADLATYFAHAEQFGNDNDYLLIGIESPHGIFDSTFLAKIDQLTQHLRSLPHVTGVTSPTTAKSTVVESFGFFEVPYLHPAEPARYAADSARIYQTESLVGTLFSPDARSVALAVETTKDLRKLPGDTLMAGVHQKLQELELTQTHLAGKVLAQSMFVDRMREELAVFITASIGLLVLFLWGAFRTWWGVVIPIGIVILAILLTLGIMGAFGFSLDLMTVLLPSILFVVGMSDAVHVVTRFISGLQDRQDRLSALKTAMREVALAKFATSFTTAVGFLSLLMVKIEPVANFGIFAATGVMIAYLLSVTVLPALLLLVPLPHKITLPDRHQLLWLPQLRRLFGFLVRRRRAVLLTSLLITVGASFAISLIRVDASLLDDLNDNDPIKQDFRYFEKNFSGVRPFEMRLAPGRSGQSLLSLPALQEQEKLEQYLRKTYGLSFVVSPVTVVKSLNQAVHGGEQQQYRLPQTESEHQQLQRYLKALLKREEVRQVLAADGSAARISGKMADIGSYRATQLHAQLEQHLQTQLNPQLLQATLTGSAYLLDKNNEYLTLNLLKGLTLAVAIIAGLMLLMFRSWKMILIALLPNMLPMLLIAAYMGLMGVHLKVSTALIFTIAFGIAVDDTIYFLSKFRLELHRGHSVIFAVRRALLSTGKSMVITSCMIVAGFLTLLFSSFDGTFYMGLLISLTLIFALAADLLLLPVLVMLFYRQPKRVPQHQVVA